jgi:hypothetical protein
MENTKPIIIRSSSFDILIRTLEGCFWTSATQNLINRNTASDRVHL